MADVSVRPARAGEAEAIARIQRDTMALAYERVLPPETFAALADPRVQADIAANIASAITAGSGRVFIALDGETVVGVAAVGPAVGATPEETVLEAGDTDGEHTGYLEQILVEPRWGRRGHGSRLLSACMDYFGQAGFVRAITWVPEQNPATTGLLTSAGWAPDGFTRGLAGAGTTVTEVRLHTALTESPDLS